MMSEHDFAEQCAGSSSEIAVFVPSGTRPEQDLVGGDRDAHGCIGSAGYSWCASLSDCIRPWEHNLTSEHDMTNLCGDNSFAASASAVTAETRGPLGGDSDAHGCTASAGYRWCASMSECIRPWEHQMMSEHDFAEQCAGSSSEIAV